MKSEKKIYPLLLLPVSKEIIWGGNLLRKKYNKTSVGENIAESWELTVRKNEISVISNGEYKGMLLSEYLGEEARTFPLLIKFIDAADRLSVQVHPADGGKDTGKTELWYIIEADDGASLVYGLKDDVTVDDFRNSVLSGKTEECLKYVKVKKGDIFFIPAGQVHAIGQGILLLEIQQNSDTTYRIYDYQRKDKNGKERPLHIDDALHSLVIRGKAQIEELRFSEKRGQNIVASCDKFTVYKYDIYSSQEFSFDDFSAVICISGEGNIRHNEKLYPITAGNTYYMPKNIGKYTIFGQLEVLIAEE